MRLTPIQLTISVILVASLLLSLLRFGGTSRRGGNGNGNGNGHTRVVTTITTTQLDIEPVGSDDGDGDHMNFPIDDNGSDVPVRITKSQQNIPSSDHSDQLFTLTEPTDDDNTNDNDNNRILPYAIPHGDVPITRYKPSSHDAQQRRRHHFGTLFRSPLSSGQVQQPMEVVRGMIDDGFDRVWLPALHDIEAARSALLIHDGIITADGNRMAELQLAADMVSYRSWRIDCVTGAIDRCHGIRQAVEILHQRLLAALTSPLLQRIKCQMKHYTAQRPGVTAAQRNMAREQWSERESELTFQVALCGQGDLSSCQHLKQLLLSTATNATRDGTPDHSVTVLCGNSPAIQLLSAGDMALNLALSTRLEQRIRQLRDWIWARQMDDNWHDEHTAGFGSRYNDAALRTSSSSPSSPTLTPSDAATPKVELKPVNASDNEDEEEDDDDEEEPAVPNVLRNYRPKLTAAQEVTHGKCHDLIKQYNIQPFKGWGRAPSNIQSDWKKWNCDQLLMIRPYNNDPHAIVALMKTQWSECVRMQAEFEIIPNVTWGSAASKTTWTWKRRNCDLFMWLKPPPPPSDPFWESSIKHIAKNGTLPSIAICIATTTRNIPHVTKMMDLSLFLHTIPALAKSLQPDYEYHLYIGYDQGDPYFDNAKHLGWVTDWFTLKIKQMLLAKHGIRIYLHLMMIDNSWHKPGPAFNAIIDIAYRDNGTHSYFLRMPDDFQILRPWPIDMVNALRRQPYPYGVVGLSNKEGRTDRFPAELIARCHLDILGTYYPLSLSDWWSDDWLDHVWGARRTTRIAAYGVHRLFAHGTRFQVTHSHRQLLEQELAIARERIIDWMKSHMDTTTNTIASTLTPIPPSPKIDASTIEDYSNDRFEFSIHSDVANFDYTKNTTKFKVVNHRVVSGDTKDTRSMPTPTPSPPTVPPKVPSSLSISRVSPTPSPVPPTTAAPPRSPTPRTIPYEPMHQSGDGRSTHGTAWPASPTPPQQPSPSSPSPVAAATVVSPAPVSVASLAAGSSPTMLTADQIKAIASEAMEEARRLGEALVAAMPVPSSASASASARDATPALPNLGVTNTIGGGVARAVPSSLADITPSTPMTLIPPPSTHATPLPSPTITTTTTSESSPLDKPVALGINREAQYSNNVAQQP